MMEWYGYTGNILKIDLSENKISVDKVKKKDIQQYIGGLGISCKIAADLIDPKIEPLAPENVIIIGVGPLVGTITPGASRTVSVSKFPATGAVAYSCGSMSYGFQMKHAGFDQLIIMGKAKKPIILEILDDYINLSDAGKVWGRDIVETTDFLQKKYGLCGVIAIGQAGENLVKSALA